MTSGAFGVRSRIVEKTFLKLQKNQNRKNRKSKNAKSKNKKFCDRKKKNAFGKNDEIFLKRSDRRKIGAVKFRRAGGVNCRQDRANRLRAIASSDRLAANRT